MSEQEKKEIDLKCPVPELEGSYPLVLYFNTETARDDFLQVVLEAAPGLTAKKL